MYAKEKREYVKKLSEVLKPMQDFGGIRYANEHHTGAEYIKVWDDIGGAQFLDVTGYSLEKVLEDVAKIVLRKCPDSVITSTEKKREVTRLFRIQEAL
jgi:hypothetical protein